MMLSIHPDLEVVGEASQGAEAVKLTRELTPDVVVMDIGMPGMDGVEATRHLTADNFTPDPDYTAKVLILTGLGDDEHVYAALRAGASGFVLKDAAPAELASAIECVANGNGYLAPAVTRGVIAGIATRPSPAHPTTGALDRLTPTRARNPHPHGLRPHQRRHRRTAAPRHCHRQDPRLPHHHAT
jgi:DNA-binding NarL/FixJ family response regulator